MIVIAGAGIGGLTLGCALARAGHPFRILERAPELRPVGAGIALSENALRALAHIDLDGPVRASGHALGVAGLWDAHGRVLVESQLRELVAGTTIAMTRAGLQHTLLAELMARQPDASVRLGCAVEGYEPHTTGVVVRLSNGETIDADILVGADGLHSAVRRTLRGDEPLCYAGYTSWRAIVDGIEPDDPDRFTESWGPGCRFGIVPLADRRVYWFAVADAPAGGRDAGDPRDHLRARFAGWHAPIDRILAATPRERIVRTDIFDRPPIDRWIDGRVALLGDAAHPMTPNLGQGGGQAIEDAVVLADAIHREPSIGAALERYQSRRVARANGFVVRSFRFGQMAHVRGVALQWLRNQALRAIPVRVTARALARDMEFKM